MYHRHPALALAGTPLEDLLVRARQGAEDTLKLVLSSSENFRLATCSTKQQVIQKLEAWISAEQSLVTNMAGVRGELSETSRIPLDAAISQLNAAIKVCQTGLEGMKQTYNRECAGAVGPAASGGGAILGCALVALGITAYCVLRRK